MWGGRFAAETDPLAAEFTRSIEVDRALALDDLAGSVAHVHGLARAGLVTADEEAALVAGLEGLADEVASGTFAWDAGLEDVHLNLEAALAARVGPVAGKLHTGRSRNDQVALDLRLWLRRTLATVDEAVVGLERALVERAERDGEGVMPGMTHVQPAQPVLLAHHLLAYVEMLERDRGRFRDAWSRADRSPLGAGALAGAGFALDRESIATELGFAAVTANSLDAVSDRDFVVEALAAAAVCLVHLSRLAEELVWWSSPAFGWVSLDDAWSTGSSMMPNKKNPDPAELIRGRAGRVIGQVTGILATLKGLPLGYQRDLQETVAPAARGDGRPRVVAARDERRDRLAQLPARSDASGSARRVSDRDLGGGRPRRAWRAIPRGPWRGRGTRRRCGAARLPTRRAARRGVRRAP